MIREMQRKSAQARKCCGQRMSQLVQFDGLHSWESGSSGCLALRYPDYPLLGDVPGALEEWY